MKSVAAGLFALALGLLPARALAEKSAVNFRPLTLEAARAAAQTEGKIVFIDFYTTWCEPCKRLDRETWTDAKVGKLVDARAVALKLDAEKEGRAAAKHYTVTAYPTLLLLKPDGTELDRIIGYRDAAKFIAEFSAGAEGRPAVVRAREVAAKAAAGERETVQARHNLARVLAQRGQSAEALEHYLWCYDEGMVRVSSFVGVRNSFLTMDLGRLARDYAPAREAIVVRRDAARERLLGGETRAVSDFAALNDALGEPAANLTMFDQLPAGDARRRGFGLRLQAALVEARRYQDALEAMPASSMVRLVDGTVSRFASTPADVSMTRAAAKTHVPYVEILAGAGDVAQARELIGKILAIDATEGTCSLLRQAVERAGQPELSLAIVRKP